MKRILLAVAMTLALPTLILCQTSGKIADKKGGDEQAVRQVINDIGAALRNNDAAALGRIYADDFTFVTDTGVLTNRAQRLAAFTSGNVKYESVSFENISVRIYGKTAVATFGVTSKFAPGTNISSGKFIVTATLVKQNGRWQEVAVQNTRVVEQ